MVKTRRRRRPEAAASLEPEFLVVRTRPVFDLDDEQFFRFCQLNGDLRIERAATGEIIIMPPVGGEGSSQNAELTTEFVLWTRTAGGGRVFDSSGGFKLPNGATRSPDVCWVRQERLEALTKKQWTRFLPLCPDFALELRSASDRLPTLQKKMVEYVANGTQLGWLIDPLERQAFIYRPGAPVEHLENPAALSGEPVLTGFTLEMASVWGPAAPPSRRKR